MRFEDVQARRAAAAGAEPEPSLRTPVRGLLLDDPANIDAVLDEAKRLAAEGTAVCINVHLADSDFREGSISI